MDYKNKKATKSGFSLVELMVTIVIIGVLSAIAIPSYRTYIIRSKVIEAMFVAENIKSKIMAYYTDRGIMPNNTIVLGINKSGYPYYQVDPAYNVNEISTIRILVGNGCASLQCVDLVFSWDSTALGAIGKVEMWIRYGEQNGFITSVCGIHPELITNGNVKYFPSNCQNKALNYTTI